MSNLFPQDVLNSIALYQQSLAQGSAQVYVDGRRSDTYTPDGTFHRPFKTIQAAIDSITDESGTKRYNVNVAPGIYSENVTLKRFVGLAGSAGFGPVRSVQIATAAGVALSIPFFDSYSVGVSVSTSGAAAAEAAIRVFDDGGPGTGVETFLVNYQALSSTIARALWVEPGGMVVCIYGDVNGSPGGDAIYVDGSAIILFLGGSSEEAEVGLRLLNGAMAMVGAGYGLSASEASPTAWTVDMDASSLFMTGGARANGTNGFRLQNGAMLIFESAVTFGGFTGVPMDVDVASVVFLGESSIDGIGGVSWGSWNMAGTCVAVPSVLRGQGLAAGRPVGVCVSYKYFATDLAGGNGLWLTWNGAAWVDPAGVVVP